MNQTSTRKALGKGLEQLFSNEQIDFNQLEQEIVSNTKENEIVLIPLDEIRSNPYQPRTYFDEDSLRELATSIKEHGVFTPIIVKKDIKGYLLIAGERRTKASKLAGLKEIPAIIKDFDDQAMMEIALIENIQRENLSPIEEAEAIKKFMDKTSFTQEEVAKRFGKSRTYITNTLGLLNLPDNIKEEVNQGIISMSHARVLSKMDNPVEIENLVNKIKLDKISVRQLEDYSRNKTINKKHPIYIKDQRPSKYKIYEETMREVIGTRVTIASNKITIPFDTANDLDRIMEILNIEIGE